jgi:hypothetical protein
MAEPSPPYWELIAALFSSLPLTPSLAMTLYQAACDLYERDEGTGEVIGDLANGRVHNLRKHVLLGSYSGPAFEARLETERGAAMVRFLITRAGLAWMEQPHRSELLN